MFSELDEGFPAASKGKRHLEAVVKDVKTCETEKEASICSFWGFKMLEGDGSALLATPSPKPTCQTCKAGLKLLR